MEELSLLISFQISVMPAHKWLIFVPNFCCSEISISMRDERNNSKQFQLVIITVRIGNEAIRIDPKEFGGCRLQLSLFNSKVPLECKECRGGRYIEHEYGHIWCIRLLWSRIVWWVFGKYFNNIYTGCGINYIYNCNCIDAEDLLAYR